MLKDVPQYFVENRITVVTTQQLLKPKRSEKHQKERIRLLQRLGDDKNSKTSQHPRNRLFKALHGFLRYGQRNLEELKRWRDLYNQVPRYQKKTLEHVVQYQAKLDINEQLILKNHQLCQKIVQEALEFYEFSTAELESYMNESEAKDQKADRVSVSQALKHYVRDWSSEGVHEREGFSCVIDTIGLCAAKFEHRATKLLLPGAGLGRLGADIAAYGGYEVTLNEWSMFMNLAYRFLESQSYSEQHGFYPFVDSWSHHATTNDLQRMVIFPDQLFNASSMLLVEGDFTTAFQESTNTFDFIVTYFFIDTARNLMNYLETIHKTLKKGGYWINSGPLLYGSGPWVQLSLDEIIAVSEYLGFEFLESAPSCGEPTLPGKKVRSANRIYGSNERALNINGYKVQSWIARKK